MAHHAFNPPPEIADTSDRFLTMSIASKGDCTVSTQRRSRSTRDSHDVSDIPGAVPRPMAAFRELRRPPVEEIAGARPAAQHPKLNKVSTVCTNLDIEGSTAAPSTFSTKRVVDPLAPQYSLPRVPVKTEPPPPFLKDSLDTSDIHGTKPGKLYKYKERNSHDVSDIPGTHPSWQPQNKQLLSGEARDIINVHDIVSEGEKFRTTRVTDPLRPSHTIHGIRVEDDDPGMIPKPLPKGRKGGINFSLTTGDIEGANTEFKPAHTTPGGIPEHKRRQFRKTNTLDDVDGAQADTLKRAMRTKRVTNPNERNYPSLDGKVHHIPERMLYAPADPRDVELQRLRAEVSSLRKDAEIMRLENELKALKTDGGGGGGGGGGGRHRPPRPESSASGVAGYDSTADIGRAGLRSSASSASYSRSLRSSHSSPALRSPASSYLDATGPAPASRGGGRSLHSSSSRPSVRSTEYARVGGTSDVLRLRTPMSARSTSSHAHAARSSRQEARAAREAVDSVCSLPDTPARSALQSAGSASLRA